MSKKLPPDLVRNGVEYWETADGNFRDKDGTIYPYLHFDENRCGLDNYWATRIDDPLRPILCVPHDKGTDRIKAGYPLPGETPESITEDFIETAAEQALDGVGEILNGSVIKGSGRFVRSVLYGILGGFGGWLSMRLAAKKRHYK